MMLRSVSGWNLLFATGIGMILLVKMSNVVTKPFTASKITEILSLIILNMLATFTISKRAIK